MTFLFHHLLDKTAWEWLGKYADMELTEDQMRALVFVRETTQIGNLAFREISGLDTLSASKSLRKLQDLGLLEKCGNGSATHYMASKKLMDDLANLHGEELSLHGKEPNLHGKEPSLHGKESKFSADLKRRLLHLSMGKRAAPDEIKSVIVELCGYGPFSKEQIARFISRDQAHIAQTYLTPLVKENLIEMTFAETPSHPDQQYRTVKKK